VRVYYDLHIHTALSPCGDDDMTPFNVANMALLNGLSVIAITDHNSVGNCEAVVKPGEEIGLTVICGMELETAEEVHVVMLFPSVEQAKACEKEVDKHRFRIANKPEVYGRQLLLSDTDEPLGEVEDLLVVATDIGVYEVVALAKRYGGIAYPAHIDRPSHGILQMLGGIDDGMGFTAVELSSSATEEQVAEWEQKGYAVVRSSDAHYLHNLNEQSSNFFELDCVDAQRVLNKLDKR
jgi:PHP family Zn ribbon phosphoesterase